MRWLVAAAAALALAGCVTEGDSNALNVSPRGASVAFESIDGPPQGQFYKLVQDLNDEAHVRRVAVTSRERTSDYRVRGYLAAEVEKGQTSISWVWDVFAADGQRALRISGREAAPGKSRDAWSAADDAVLKRIAASSMDQLAAFLTSAEAAPQETLTLASFGLPSTPEAAGIFRIFRPEADPVPGTGESPAAESADEAVPLPRRRPTISAGLQGRQTVAVAAGE